ncbi:hypothetical protein [Bradyrhizobium sp. Tv2a-2]|uniref:hypothetical protein n=1 Tax=Bradyrhizobium sp. Tv2a-2 TaxID=113395 RepID=UPI000404C2BE|nr:hypothetical protein [Bradyrhizobium sp. Tv2a-2]
MSLATQRFEELRREYRRRIPSRRLAPRQHHDIQWAAALQQVAEMAAIENVAHAAKHERKQIDSMRAEVARLASVSARKHK